VPRLEGHTFIDDQSYKSADLRAKEAGQDPISQLKAFLLSGYISTPEWEDLEHKVQQDARQALEEAEAFKEPDPSRPSQHLF
jgi:2-oxoisovalerate dehydrogenase E1 component